LLIVTGAAVRRWAAVAALFVVVFGASAGGFPCVGVNVVASAEDDRVPFFEDVNVPQPPIAKESNLATYQLIGGHLDIAGGFEPRKLMWLSWPHYEVCVRISCGCSSSLNVRTEGNFGFLPKELKSHRSFNDCAGSSPMVDGGNIYMGAHWLHPYHHRFKERPYIAAKINDIQIASFQIKKGRFSSPCRPFDSEYRSAGHQPQGGSKKSDGHSSQGSNNALIYISGMCATCAVKADTDEQLDDKERLFVKGLVLLIILALLYAVGERIRRSDDPD
jgi:hypothetical protein